MGGVFYVHDSETGKQESLGTRDRAEATTLLNARNESVRQPQLNLHIAKAYLAGTDSGVSTRTWQNALDAIVESKTGSTQDRWRRAAKETGLDLIRDRVIIETQAEQLLACLKAGTVSTNVHLRKLHNFCLAMNWLPWPLIPKRLWPEVHYQPKRAITMEEHLLIIGRERNQERRSFYELCWHLGGSQTDIANLKAALKGQNVVDVFMPAVSPGQVVRYHVNQHYKTADEFLLAVRAAVDELPHDLKVSMLLHHYQNLSYREIAAIAHCSERGVETRLYRARQILRQHLGTFIQEASNC